MRRSARIFWIHARVGMLAELQYRTDVWMRLITSLVLMGASLASIGIVYGKVDEIRGWTSADLVVVLGVFFLVGAVVNGIVHNSMAQLAKDIKLGTLDFRLLKPVDAQLIALVQKVDAWRVIDVVLGVGLCAFGISRGGFEGSAHDVAGVLGGVLLLVGSGCIIAGFWMLVTCISFWTIQGEEMMSRGHNRNLRLLRLYRGRIRAGGQRQRVAHESLRRSGFLQSEPQRAPRSRDHQRSRTLKNRTMFRSTFGSSQQWSA